MSDSGCANRLQAGVGAPSGVLAQVRGWGPFRV